MGINLLEPMTHIWFRLAWYGFVRNVIILSVGVFLKSWIVLNCMVMESLIWSFIVCMILCGLVWLSKVYYANVFPCKVSNGLVCLCMVLYGLTQLCTIFVLVFNWTTMDKLEFTDGSEVQRRFGSGEVAIFRQRMIIAPPLGITRVKGIWLMSVRARFSSILHQFAIFKT